VRDLLFSYLRNVLQFVQFVNCIDRWVSMSRPFFDLFVVGNGPTGASLACSVAMRNPNLKIAVAEASILSKRQPTTYPDCRVLALSPASIKLLTDVGVWAEVMSSGRVAPYYSMIVWDGSSAGQVSFGATDRLKLGCVVENWLLQEALVDRMRQLPNITLMCPDTVSALSPSERKGPMQVTLSSGELETALVAGCDGASSPIAKLAGLASRTGWRYGQNALVCAVQLVEGELCSTAYQRFLPGGQVLALLPLYDNFASVVWSTSPEHARILSSLPETDFLAELHRALSAPVVKPGSLAEWLFPASVCRPAAVSVPLPQLVVGQRAAFPLQVSHAQSYVSSRVALVGDAAHTMHPLAGQGFNLALGDVAALSDCISGACRDGQDFGTDSVLQEYQQKRKVYNSVSLIGVDFIQKVFSIDWEPFVQARGGLNSLLQGTFYFLTVYS
jgi:ubiquinone biosynthesis UbiH/UbiF/VisC/COQ6 family hydroxylase